MEPSQSKYGCIGKTLQHSFSRVIHDMLTPQAHYALWELPTPQAFQTFMEQKAFAATNVTIPYKQDVIPYLAHISPIASRIGAVNTICNRNGTLWGYNTDHFGMTALIQSMHIDLNGRKVLICGTGGTSKTAVAVAEDLGASEIYRLSRTKRDEKENIITYEDAYTLHTDAQIVINTTPAGMFPHHTDAPLELERFHRIEGVIDAVYNPLRTSLVLQAQERDIPASGGLYMLVAQAVRASELFFDTVYPTTRLDDIFQSIAHEKENIVLTGMPGSGKTTVGKHLAKLLNRPFVDTDEIITQEIGTSIANYFDIHGEEAFRTVERACIREHIAPRTGCIIATGGGAVMDVQNVRYLKQNGTLFFLDRPLHTLFPTADRPLARDVEALQQRYEERYETYCQTADVRVQVTNDAETTAQQIARHFSATRIFGKKEPVTI